MSDPYVDSSAAVVFDAAGPTDITFPALVGLADGDVVLLAIGVGFLVAPASVTPPAGFVEESTTSGNLSMYFFLGLREVVGDGPYTVTFGAGGFYRLNGAAVAYRGATGITVTTDYDTPRFNLGSPTTAYTSAFTETIQVVAFRGNDPLGPDAALTVRENAVDSAGVTMVLADTMLTTTAVPARTGADVNMAQVITLAFVAPPATSSLYVPVELPLRMQTHVLPYELRR